MALSRAFLATVYTLLRAPKKPLVAFKTFFLLFREATAFTDLGIFFQFNLTGGFDTALGLADSYEWVFLKSAY